MKILLLLTILFMVSLVSATNPAITSVNAYYITFDSAELEGNFTYGDFDNVTTRFYINDVLKSSITHTKDIEETGTHYYYAWELDTETDEYYFQIEWIDGTQEGSICDDLQFVYGCDGGIIEVYPPPSGGSWGHPNDGLAKLKCEQEGAICCHYRMGHLYNKDATSISERTGTSSAAGLCVEGFVDTYHTSNSSSYNMTEGFDRYVQLTPPPTIPDVPTVDIDSIFDVFDDKPVWVGVILGIVLILAILFISIKYFGEANVKINEMAVIIFVFIGVILATVIGLFPIYIILLVIVLSLVWMLIRGVLK